MISSWYFPPTSGRIQAAYRKQTALVPRSLWEFWLPFSIESGRLGGKGSWDVGRCPEPPIATC